MHLTVRINDNTKEVLQELKKVLLTENDSYVVRLAIHKAAEIFLHNNIPARILNRDEVIPTVNLPGMNERIVKTQMERWQLTAEEYSAIVQKLINDFAASGGQMKNPENVIWKACSRYAHERDIQKKAAAAQTATLSDGDGESIYELQDRLG